MLNYTNPLSLVSTLHVADNKTSQSLQLWEPLPYNRSLAVYILLVLFLQRILIMCPYKGMKRTECSLYTI